MNTNKAKDIMPATLPKSPNRATMELLIRTRMLLEHSLSHSAANSPLDRMIAIHGLDNTIEWLVRIVIRHLDIEVITGKNFENRGLVSLVGETNQFLQNHYKSSLPYLSDIKMLRQVRNLVQHGAVDPASELQRFTRIVEHFFVEVLRLIFGLSRDALRISSLIKDEEIRKIFERAEQKLDQGAYLESVVSCRNAFENAFFKQSSGSASIFVVAATLIGCTMTATQRSHQFVFNEMANELELIRLGIDRKRYERFAVYLEHIPGKYRAERYGWSVMQRPWEEKDAKFCYSFVCDVVLRWEQKEHEALYVLKLEEEGVKRQNKIVKIGSVTIEDRDFLEGGVLYDFDDGEELQLSYVRRELKDELSKLETGKDYNHIAKYYTGGQLDIRISKKIRLLAVNSRLVTNHPERWEVILWTEQLPFTWKREDYEEGKKVKESPRVNTASVSEIIGICDGVITNAVARKITAYRRDVGPIRSIDDLKKISGVTQSQVSSLAYFSRAE